MLFKNIRLSQKAAVNLSIGLMTAAAVLPMNSAASHAQPADSLINAAAAKQVRTQRPVRRPGNQIEPAPANPTPSLPIGGAPVLNGNGCPEGTVLVMFDMPIYDDDGIFVVGYEPTPICIDENTVPAG